MSFLTRRGEGPSFCYAGRPMHVLAGQDGQPEGFAAMEILIPAHFAGPIPHAHDEFDEAIYILRGQLRVTGDQTLEAAAGSMFTAPRGSRHGFSNPYDAEALVLGVWAPAGRPWPSCARSARRCHPTRHPTRTRCASCTSGTPAACCPDASR